MMNAALKTSLEVGEDQPWIPRRLPQASTIAPSLWVPIRTFIMKFSALFTEEDPAPLIDIPWFRIRHLPLLRLAQQFLIMPPREPLIDALGFITHDWWRFFQRQAAVPPPRQRLIDQNGNIVHDWWRFFQQRLKIEPPRQPLVDADGFITHDWWRYLQHARLILQSQ